MKLLYAILHVVIVAVSVMAIIVPPEAPATNAKNMNHDSLNATNMHRLVNSPNMASRDVLATYPPPSHQHEVKEISANLSLPNIQSWVDQLTVYHNRYLVTDSGAESAEWFVRTVGDIISKYPGSGATVHPFIHTWAQNSVIARIPGSTDGPVTIIAAHLDSINRKDLHQGRAPGADDNAAAAADLIEVFRVLLASGFKPRTAVEFHWYSGEEPGSLGSQPIAKSYKDAGTRVKAMMNFVLTAYIPPDTEEVIAVMPDYVSAGLSNFLVQVIEQYSTLPHIESNPCGYPCSDHAIWHEHGYPTCFPLESPLDIANPFRHSENDTIHVPGFSWSHTFEFAKIGLAFAYELSV